VFADTISQVSARPLTNAKLRRLEVDGLLPSGVVGASQIGGTRNELRDYIVDSLKNGL